MLADDLALFQQGKPVRARRLNPIGHAWRWCRRKPTMVSLMAASAATVLMALTLITWQRQHAQSERRRSSTAFHTLTIASSELMELSEEWLRRMPENIPARHQLLLKSAALYEQFLQANPNGHAAQTQLAIAYCRVASVRRMLGQHEEACKHYQTSIDLSKELSQRFSADPQHRYWWAHCARGLGESQRSLCQARHAESSYRTAIRLLQQLDDEFPMNPAYIGELGRTYNNLGLLLTGTDRASEEKTLYRQAILVFASLGDRLQMDPSLQQGAAHCHINLGILLKQSGDLCAADQACRQANGFLAELLQLYPDHPEYAYELATASMNWANLLYQHRRRLGEGDWLEAAERRYRDSIQLLAELTVQYSA